MFGEQTFAQLRTGFKQSRSDGEGKKIKNKIGSHTHTHTHNMHTQSTHAGKTKIKQVHAELGRKELGFFTPSKP